MKKTIYSQEYKKLREWLVGNRHSRKLTQRDVAKLLNITHSWIGKIEQGERRIDLIEYIRICNALGVDPHEGLRVVIGAMKERPSS